MSVHPRNLPASCEIVPAMLEEVLLRNLKAERSALKLVVDPDQFCSSPLQTQHFS